MVSNLHLALFGLFLLPTGLQAGHYSAPIDSFDLTGVGFHQGEFDGWELGRYDTKWVKLEVHPGDRFQITSNFFTGGSPAGGSMFLYYPNGDNFAEIGDGMGNLRISIGAGTINSNGIFSFESATATYSGQWALAFWNDGSINHSRPTNFWLDIKNLNDPNTANVPDQGATLILLAIGLGLVIALGRKGGAPARTAV